MFKRIFNNESIIHIAILLLCLVPILTSFILITDGNVVVFKFNNHFYRAGLPCAFKLLTGYNCPSCGMTRSFIYMSGLNFSEAFKLNKAGFLLYIFCLIQIFYRIVRILKPKLSIHRSFVRFQAAFLILIGIVDLQTFIFQFF